MKNWTRRQALFATAAIGLAGCGEEAPRLGQEDFAPDGTLAWAIDGAWRIERERDEWRHPLQTLQFWGLAPAMTVLEILPGRGWYTSILAPYLAHNEGHLIAASFDPRSTSLAQRETLASWEARFTSDPDLYGEIQRTIVGRGELAPAASVDLAILANNVHTLMAEGVAEQVLRQTLAALKPGGTFGVEQHRAASTGLQDPLAGTGYVQEAYVKALAEEAGFEFVSASDVNANPRDTRDHPFGVWTLPPTLRTSPLGDADDPNFNSGPYATIGESDRMTLRFRKPIGAGARAAIPAP